jgi:hypothetical protein
MKRCEVCHNEYDKIMEIKKNGESHYFDSFECAIHMLAPKCNHCQCSIIGHGLEKQEKFYCCKSCANKEGVEGFSDRI